MGRSPCCDKMGLKKGSWMPEEDAKLLTYIQQNGHGNWHALPSKAGLRRCGKSCRLRWANYLRPDIKRGKFSPQEDDTIIQLHALLGNRWSAIATHLPRRTDNEIKNYWNTHLKKRLTKMGIDPVTHKPTNQESDIRHMAQWETARLEAEARSSKLDSSIKVSNLSQQWAVANTHISTPASSALFNQSLSMIRDLNYPSSMDLHHIVHPPPQLCYPLGFQSSVKDDTPSSYPPVVGGCWGVPEDDDNTLNAITRPVEARLYHGGKSSGKLGI